MQAHSFLYQGVSGTGNRTRKIEIQHKVLLKVSVGRAGPHARASVQARDVKEPRDGRVKRLRFEKRAEDPKGWSEDEARLIRKLHGFRKAEKVEKAGGERERERGEG